MAEKPVRKEDLVLDADRARASLDRLYNIYKDIAATADEVMQTRCPYKNADSRCTA